jgi:DNA (cytosine-5)-methyltransferase 1
MRHGSLFSGIGGFDLAAEWMGWENVFHCEWNTFGQKVLHHYWPNAEQYTDITKSDFTKYANTIDILTGGFPCQPYSSAGKRLGKEDDRHLWPQMLRAIKEIAPRWVVGENVRGLINWNGGMVFEEVCADLENLGYQVTSFLIPACATNAPHKRERIWIVAHNKINGFEKAKGVNQWQKHQQKNWDNIRDTSDTNGRSRDVTYTECIRPLLRDSKKKRKIQSGFKSKTLYSISKWETFPTVPPVCVRNDGISDRLDSITFSKWRNESIKAGGNAIVPQVVYQIFKTIEQYENLQNL